MTDAGGDVLAPGTRLGSYRIDRLLGRGGMGEVYLAFDTTLRRQVALKVVAESVGGDDSRAHILREARSAAALNHPGICTIYEVGEADGVAFIAMEYVEGQPLRDRIDAGTVPKDVALECALQAADALSYAHDHGVVHRDLKAANAILTRQGRLKLVDFGLALRRDRPAPEESTLSALAPAVWSAGTPYAMAPEQVRGEAPDARTDIWALGVLIYELAAGLKPFGGQTTAELFSAILRDAPRPVPDRVPGELRMVIERCLEKDPERRYQHASEVRASLETIRAGAAVHVSGPRRRVVPRPWLVIVTSLAAVLSLIAGFNLGGIRDRLSSSPPVDAAIRLAVLPLENRTGDSQQDHLSDGLTDELVAMLGRLKAGRLTVIAPASTARYKHSDKSVAQIGVELDATAVLKGSVARSGNRLQIDAELIRTSNGRRVWHDTYDRDIGDLFALEHELSGSVARALGIPVAAPQPGTTAVAARVNPEAYDLYLRGISHAVLDNEKDVDQAIELLERSAALDPAFVPVQAYLALAYGTKSAFFRPNEPQWEEKGFAAARKALDLNPDAPEAHYAQAMMLWRPSHRFPHREALAELRQALAAQPNFDEAWHVHGTILFHVGHLDAGERDIQRTIQINPGNTLARFRFGPIKVYQQRFEDALAAIDRVPRESYPAQWTYQKAWALLSLGRLDEAGRLMEETLRDNPVDQGGVIHAARAMLRARRGDRTGALADVAEATREGKGFIHFHHTAYSIGAVYAALGDFAKAQDWIENAANDGFPNYAFFESDVHLDRLRTTPRFRAFLARLRAEWEHIPGEPD